MDQNNILFLCPEDQPPVKLIRSRLADRIQGIGHDHKLRPFAYVLPDPIQIRQIMILPRQGISHKLRSRKGRPDGEYRIARIGHQNHVSGITKRKSDVCDSLLGTVHGRDFPLIKLHAVPAFIPADNRPDQLRQILQ